MQIAYKAKYLGFILGPKKGDNSWKKPVDKLRKRMDLWQDIPAGLFWNCRIYNTFLLPIPVFVAQLEKPPQFAVAAAEEAKFILFLKAAEKQCFLVFSRPQKKPSVPCFLKAAET